jgi:mono/diheme cytochrome c family protein
MRTRSRAAIACAAGLWAAMACRHGATGEWSRLDRGFGGAPRSAAMLRNPYDRSPEAVGAGRKLYGLRCARCHGENREGRARAPALAAAPVRQAPPGEPFWYLTNGRLGKGMPAWSRLPEAQRWQLVTFLRSLPGAPGP